MPVTRPFVPLTHCCFRVRWIRAFISALPPVSELDARHLRHLVCWAARSKARLAQEPRPSGPQQGQGGEDGDVYGQGREDGDVAAFLGGLPGRIRGKLAVYSSRDAAGLLRDLLLLHRSGVCDLDEGLREDLAALASSGIATLGARELAELVGVLTPVVLMADMGTAAEAGPKTMKLHSQSLVSSARK